MVVGVQCSLGKGVRGAKKSESGVYVHLLHADSVS